MIQGLYKIFDHWHKEGTVHIYSDPHFSDKDISYRPDDETLIKLINSKVGRKDTLIVLGDVGNIDCVRRLHGYKVLVCGNHDIGHTQYERKIKTRIYDADKYTREQCLSEVQKLYPECKCTIEQQFQFNQPFEYWEVKIDNCLFDEVYAGPLMISEKIILSHEPIPHINWGVNIHGHVHDTRHKNDLNHFNCCAEAINYIPINFNQWVKSGYLANIETLHRDTIDQATKRKKKKEAKQCVRNGKHK